MTDTYLSPLAEVPLSETPEDRLARLKSEGAIVAVEGPSDGKAWSHDMVDWIAFLAHACEVPARVSWLSDGALLRIGPEGEGGSPGSWMTVTATFDDSGCWSSVRVANEYSGKSVGMIPQASWGLPTAIAAGLLGLQIEMNSVPRRPSWMHWREERSGVARAAAGAHVAPKGQDTFVKRIRDMLITGQIRQRALETVARENEEQFRMAFNAEIIMTAMSSDWYPPRS